MSRIFLSRAHVTEVEERLVLEALRSGWVAPLGPMVDRFESEIADRVGVRHALALSSGTAALHLALLAEGAGPGKVVVLPSMTFAATANAVLYTGAEPVFVDSSAGDANVDVDLLVSAVDTLLAEGRDIACVLAVDLFGRCLDYSRLLPELEIRGVPLVEDAAEALGASHAGEAAGSFGHSAALSFNGNKIMTTSGGGMLLSDDVELINHARYLSTQARQPVPWYEHTEMGFNYRMSNILAALGVGQLSRLDDMIRRRRQHRERYAAELADLPGVRLLGGGLPEDASNDNCWLTCLVIDGVGTSADAVVAELGKHEIEARHLWKPMHLQPLYSSARAFLTGASETLFAHGVTLPSGSELSNTDIDRVISALTGILKGRVEAA
ncbi:DegT/DnrJ/EryC1/StrS aminotransferase family protein [Microlunatus sp. Gsoil 973]|uniref:DegT/DnrJ/EryC1/StrS family aminotransferase n=1 Tax=Microlunatus sp. Gsoil 973 TaxID=2672569 RepID=UPI0012B4A9EB|nr:aminotransferase class I/II-fold pyridoxal phosphate-dependent enzyme [Microlunatus sp. Gsoil 973]QGN32789.1 aminotransferase class I/II-fold pyridoxal phosphate-dependent enzyme [Microlunatus sp. Gsoil 973]